MNNLRGAGVGAISAFLTAELAEALHIDGSTFGGALFSYAANTGVTTVLNTVVSNVMAGSTDIFAGLGGQLFENASAGFNLASFGSFVGTYLAKEVVRIENIGGSIGSSLGSAIGTTAGIWAGAQLGVGTTIIGSIGASTAVTTAASAAGIQALASLAGGIIIPGIGAFICAALGILIGNAVGGYFQGEADDWANAQGALYEGGDAFKNSGSAGNKDYLINTVGAARNKAVASLNQIVATIGGKVLSDSQVSVSFTLQQSGAVQIASVSESNSRGDPGDKFYKPVTGANIMGAVGHNHTVIHALKRLEIAGGDLYIKRAIDRTQARTLSALMGEIKVAEDYGRYMQNKDEIDEHGAGAEQLHPPTSWLALPGRDGKRMRSEIVVRAGGVTVMHERDASWGTSKLRPQDWKSGDKLWVVEVIAPFGGAEEMVKDLKAKVFPGREVGYLAVGRDGQREVRVA